MVQLSRFRRYSRREVLANYKRLRYIRDNNSYFLYLIFEADTCVYVGETSNIFWRIIKHKDKCSDEAVIYFQEYSDKEEVLRLEKHYIRMLKPKFNSRYCQPHQLELFRLAVPVVELPLPFPYILYTSRFIGHEALPDCPPSHRRPSN
ncbi:GIY-YIG nuclease family protein [Pontibacter toksunensis]|uniref:GIY-YIG nuclease family protein n=1 Tax=Pontibacter toksunensis TaxID=1332631 RepID=A0ABW6C374_9BACT